MLISVLFNSGLFVRFGLGCWFRVIFFFFFKQKTAYEMRISDWSSDVCSSDLGQNLVGPVDYSVASISNGGGSGTQTMGTNASIVEIGRASCRERVCQYV